MLKIPCKTCNAGTMHHKKVHRMSGPAVLIGYILLIPSILGILGGASMAALSVAGGAAVMDEEQVNLDLLRTQNEQTLSAMYLTDIGVDNKLAAAIVHSRQVTSEQEAQLDFMQSARAREVIRWVRTPQNEALQHYEDMQALGNAGAALGSGMGVMFGGGVAVVSLVSGLLGYLLVMKKKVLTCDTCSATIAAS
jgi:hypothetical protein